jgi:hypothetical protein
MVRIVNLLLLSEMPLPLKMYKPVQEEEIHPMDIVSRKIKIQTSQSVSRAPSAEAAASPSSTENQVHPQWTLSIRQLVTAIRPESDNHDQADESDMDEPVDVASNVEEPADSEVSEPEGIETSTFLSHVEEQDHESPLDLNLSLLSVATPQAQDDAQSPQSGVNNAPLDVSENIPSLLYCDEHDRLTVYAVETTDQQDERKQAALPELPGGSPEYHPQESPDALPPRSIFETPSPYSDITSPPKLNTPASVPIRCVKCGSTKHLTEDCPWLPDSSDSSLPYLDPMNTQYEHFLSELHSSSSSSSSSDVKLPAPKRLDFKSTPEKMQNQAQLKNDSDESSLPTIPDSDWNRMTFEEQQKYLQCQTPEEAIQYYDQWCMDKASQEEKVIRRVSLKDYVTSGYFMIHDDGADICTLQQGF